MKPCLRQLLLWAENPSIKSESMKNIAILIPCTFPQLMHTSILFLMYYTRTLESWFKALCQLDIMG